MDFTIRQGRTKRIALGPLTKVSGAVDTLAGKTFRLMVKRNDDDPDAEAIADIRIVVSAGGALTVTPADRVVLGRPDPADPEVMIDTDPALGWFTVEFTDDDSRGWTPGPKPWELVILPGGGRVFPLRAGIITVDDTLIDDPEAVP